MRRLITYILVASLAVSAAIGIYTLFADTVSELAIRVLVTAFTVSWTSLLALASVAGWREASGAIFARVGLCSALALAALLISLTWTDVVISARSLVTLFVLSILGAHGSLLSRSRLAANQRWVRIAAQWFAVILASALLAVLWEVLGESDALWRWLAVIAILEAAASGMVVVFHVMTPPVSPTDL